MWYIDLVLLIYFKKLFENTTSDWSRIYLLMYLATTDTTCTFFPIQNSHFSNNVLFLNRKLNTFGMTNIVLYTFCKELEKTHIHIFYNCIHVKPLWEKLHECISFAISYIYIHTHITYITCVRCVCVCVCVCVCIHLYTSLLKATIIKKNYDYDVKYITTNTIIIPLDLRWHWIA